MATVGEGLAPPEKSRKLDNQKLLRFIFIITIYFYKNLR